jgi:hypothetical protein
MKSLRIRLLMLWLSFRCALLRKRMRRPLQLFGFTPFYRAQEYGQLYPDRIKKVQVRNTLQRSVKKPWWISGYLTENRKLP